MVYVVCDIEIFYGTSLDYIGLLIKENFERPLKEKNLSHGRSEQTHIVQKFWEGLHVQGVLRDTWKNE